MTRRTNVALGIALSLVTLVPACGDDDGEGTPTPTPGELSAVIGSEGGTLDGSGTPGFEQVRVVIPAGALATSATIVVRPVAEATPLPELGDACGQGYQIDGGGAELAMPIQVTLPADPQIVSAHGQMHGDVKVWALDGTEWETVDPTGTTDGTVSFDLARFTTAVAGVRAMVIATCVGSGTCAMTSTSSGSSCPGPAFCVQDLSTGPGTTAASTRIVVQGNAIYYPVRPATNQVAVVRLSNGNPSMATTSAPFTTTSSIAENLAAIMGEAWLGVRTANVRFTFDGAAPQAFDTDTIGRGAIAIADGTLVRISHGGFAARFADTTMFDGRHAALDRISALGGVSSSPRLASRSFLVNLQHDFARGVPNDSIEHVFPNPNGNYQVVHFADLPTVFATSHPPAIGTVTEGTPFAAFSAANLSAIAVSMGDGETARQIDGVPAGFDAIIDDRNDMWIASMNAPEMILVRRPLDDANRSIETIPLTTAAMGTAEFNSRLPRSVVQLSDGGIIVRTVSNRFFQIRRPGT